MLPRSWSFLRQSRTQLYLTMAAVSLFFLLWLTQTSRSTRLLLPGRVNHLSMLSRARSAQADLDPQGVADKGIYGSAASPVVDKSLSTGTDHKLSPAAAERSRSSDVPALPAHRHTSDSTSTDLQLQHGLPNGSKMHRNDTHDASSQPSMTAKEQSTALLDRASLGQEYHAQAGKPAESHSIKLADIASTKTTQNVTIKSESQSADVVQHPPKADRVDLLIVMPSSIDRMPMVTASRGWRQGVQTYVAFEQEIDLATAPAVFKEGVAKHNEVYGVCPDQVVSDAKWHKAGDLRATVAPFLANMTIGPNNFKWMLFGDDDTVFLIDNVLHLLPLLDPTVPYFMTDHLWYPQPPGAGGPELYVHANRAAPRCLPCNYTDPAEDTFESPSYQYIAPRGCPCNTQTLCEADRMGNFGQGCHWNSNTPGYWYFGHGGAGMLLSSALFTLGTYDDVVDWIWSLGQISSGDSMLMGALHNVLGIIPTDPGYGYFRPTIRLFDPGWNGLQVKGAEDENTGDNGNDPLGILDRLESALQGECSHECEDQLQHTISVHLRTRYLASELDQEEVASHVQGYEGSLDHKPAVYLHHKFAELWTQYNQARSSRSWFDVQMSA
ncbi:TPA: hypothetical protein ACH3X2_006195 [Trebouxia sp. C0005]